MEVRWNTTYAEIDCGIKLKPAINHWVDQLDNGLTGKKLASARKKKKKWHISHSQWELLERLCAVLKNFYEATLDFSVATVPTITKPLPLYKFLQKTLEGAISDLTPDDDPHHLQRAPTAGLAKLDFYLAKSFDSHYPLLGAVLHPAIRLAYFKDISKWSSDIPARAETLLEHLYQEYTDNNNNNSPAPTPHLHPQPESPKSIFDQAIAFKSTSADSETVPATTKSELASYFRGAYPCTDRNDPLGWWKVSARHYLVPTFADHPSLAWGSDPSDPIPSPLADCAQHPCNSRSQCVRGATFLEY
ncbi:hypothetical protein BDN67DRAFT_915241 [Paxillus ammoniavirescens]|nr:hypothetical protein BDN67DRAFT_915241 [Paxillus ammoniavirescens]